MIRKAESSDLTIAPSLMCANLLQLESQIRELERAGTRLFHFDIMDGHFVPNIGLNFDLARQIKDISNVNLDVHLMVDNPEQYIDRFRTLKIDWVSFHIESTRAPLRLAQAIRSAGARVGVALNPSTPVEGLRYVFSACDYVLMMTVEPGFRGQKFISASYERIGALRQELDKIRRGIDIQVDGSLDVETSARCIEQGATIIVGGSCIFCSAKDVYSGYTGFRERVTKLCKKSGTITSRLDSRRRKQ